MFGSYLGRSTTSISSQYLLLVLFCTCALLILYSIFRSPDPQSTIASSAEGLAPEGNSSTTCCGVVGESIDLASSDMIKGEKRSGAVIAVGVRIVFLSK